METQAREERAQRDALAVARKRAQDEAKLRAARQREERELQRARAEERRAKRAAEARDRDARLRLQSAAAKRTGLGRADEGDSDLYLVRRAAATAWTEARYPQAPMQPHTVWHRI